MAPMYVTTTMKLVICFQIYFLLTYASGNEDSYKSLLSKRDLVFEYLLPSNSSKSNLMTHRREERDIEGSGDTDGVVMTEALVESPDSVETEEKSQRKHSHRSEVNNEPDAEIIDENLLRAKGSKEDTYEGSGGGDEPSGGGDEPSGGIEEDPFAKVDADVLKTFLNSESSPRTLESRLGDDNNEDNALSVLNGDSSLKDEEEGSGEVEPEKETPVDLATDDEIISHEVKNDAIEDVLAVSKNETEDEVPENEIEDDDVENDEKLKSYVILDVDKSNSTQNTSKELEEPETTVQTSEAIAETTSIDEMETETVTEATTEIEEESTLAPTDEVSSVTPISEVVSSTTTEEITSESSTESSSTSSIPFQYLDVENGTSAVSVTTTEVSEMTTEPNDTESGEVVVESMPENISGVENTTLGVKTALMAMNTKLSETKEEIAVASKKPKRLGAYIVIGLILLSFLSLIGYVALKKRIKKRRRELERNQETKDTEKALLNLSEYKDHPETEENNIKNNEITPIVIKQNSQINKFEKNTNFSSPKNLNTNANEKNIEKDNVLKSTSDNLTQVIIEDSAKEIEGEKENIPNTEKLIVRTHLDQDSIPKKAIIVNRTSGGYLPVSQDNVNM